MKKIVPALALVAVLALAGCTSQTPKPSHTPSATATAQPVGAKAPTVRIPATCDQLVTPDEASKTVGVTVAATTMERSFVPNEYTDDRVGGLECILSNTPNPSYGATTLALITLRIVPGVSKQDWLDSKNHPIENEGGPAAPASFSPNGTINCATIKPLGCSYVDLISGYSIFVSVLPPQETPTSVTDFQAANTSFFQGIFTKVSALKAPAPLWEPPADSLKGATTCSGLISDEALKSALGASEVRSNAKGTGKDAFASLGSGAQVDAFYCNWVVDNSTAATISVLPGGASFFETARKNSTNQWEAKWSTVSGIGDKAYAISQGNMYLDVLAADGWIQFSIPGTSDSLAQLTSIAKTVLVKLDYKQK